MDIKDFDFDKLVRDLTVENADEVMNENIAKLEKECPEAYALFAVGRIIGKYDFMKKVSGLLYEEIRDIASTANKMKGKK